MERIKKFFQLLFSSQVDSFSVEWNSSLSHFWAMLGYSVTLNGSKVLFYILAGEEAVFDTQFLIQLLLITIPLTILESSMSQYSGKAVLEIWDSCPVMRGIGYAMLVTMFIWLVTYNLFIAITLQYLFEALTMRRKWSQCDNSFNRFECYLPHNLQEKKTQCYRLYGEVCENLKYRTSYREYLQFGVYLNNSPASINLFTVYFMLFHGVFFYFLLRKGATYLQIVVPIFMLCSAVLFTIVAVMLLTNKNSLAGLQQMFANVSLRISAPYFGRMSMTCFSPTGLGFGGITTLSSQAPFRSNSYKKSIMVCVINFQVSVAFCLFYRCACALLEEYLGSDMAVVKSKHEWFVNILNALDMDGKTMPTVLFFGSMYFLGLSSMAVYSYVWVCNLMPLVKSRFNITSSTLLILWQIVLVVFCLPLCYGYSSRIRKALSVLCIQGSNSMFVCVFQLITWVYLYGFPRILDDIHFMLGFRLNVIWQFILFICPVLSFILLIFNVYTMLFHTDEAKWFHISISMSLTCMSPIIIIGYAGWYFGVELKGNFKMLLEPSRNWKLKDKDMRRARQMFTSKSIGKEFEYRQTRRETINKDSSLENFYFV